MNKEKVSNEEKGNGVLADVSTSTIASEEHDRLLRYISYLQEKCDTIHWHYNKYERWCEFNDKH